MDALSNVTFFFYDANGNQTAVTDANLHTTYTDYDQFNRRVAVRYPDKTQESSSTMQMAV